MKALIINSSIDYLFNGDDVLFHSTFKPRFSEYNVAEYAMAALSELAKGVYDIVIMESGFRWTNGSEIQENAGYRLINCLEAMEISIPVLVYSFNRVDYITADKRKNVKGYYRRKTKDECQKMNIEFDIYPELNEFIDKIFYKEAKTREDKVKKLIDKINGEIEIVSRDLNVYIKDLTEAVINGSDDKYQIQGFKKLILLNQWKDFINDGNLFKLFTKMDEPISNVDDKYEISDKIINRLLKFPNITDGIFGKGHENTQISDQYKKCIFLTYILTLVTTVKEDDHNESTDNR